MNCGKDEIGKEGRGCERLSVPHQKLKSLFFRPGISNFFFKRPDRKYFIFPGLEVSVPTT